MSISLISPCLYKASALHFEDYFKQLLQQQGLSDQELQLVLQSRHPDVIILWADEIRVNDLRDIQQQVYRHPSRLPYRYLLIFQADRLKANYAQFLLKLLEALPSYLKVYLTALDFHQVLPTVSSRLFRGYFSEPDEELQRRLLEASQLEDLDLRIQLSCNQLDVAVGMDLEMVKPWFEDWSTVLNQKLFPAGDMYRFFSRFRTISRDTWTALWNTFLVLWAESGYQQEYLKPAMRAVRMKHQAYHRLTFETTLAEIYADYSKVLRSFVKV